MKIERMNKGSWGKVRAFFDVMTEEGFTIKGFKIIEGINGLFVSMPSQKGNDEEYYDTIWVDSKQLREELTNLAISEYNQTSNAVLEPPQQSNETNTNNMEGQEIKGDNISEDAPADTDKESSPAFSDDDIPF